MFEHPEPISGPPILAESSVDAGKVWRYKPTLFNGDRMDVDTTITFVYTLGGQPPSLPKNIEKRRLSSQKLDFHLRHTFMQQPQMIVKSCQCNALVHLLHDDGEWQRACKFLLRLSLIPGWAGFAAPKPESRGKSIGGPGGPPSFFLVCALPFLQAKFSARHTLRFAVCQNRQKTDLPF